MTDEYQIHPRTSAIQGNCPHCGHQLHGVLPIDPLFDLPQAAALIPMSVEGLSNWIYKNKHKLDLPLYRGDKQRRMHRYLRAWEIKLVRDHIFKRKTPSGKFISLATTYLETHDA